MNLGSSGDLVESLRIGHEFRGEQGASHVVDESIGLTDRQWECCGVKTAGSLALRSGARCSARECRLPDSRHGHGQIQCRLYRPLACALLGGLVDDDINEGAAAMRVLLTQDLGGDFDEIGVEFALVPC